MLNFTPSEKDKIIVLLALGCIFVIMLALMNAIASRGDIGGV